LYTGKLTELQKNRTVPNITDTTLATKDNTRNRPDSNTNRFFEAYYNVKVFTDSLQSISDSLFYSFKDSVFRLYKNPIIWAQENQITGDTIYLYTQNQKPRKFLAFENGLAINKVEKTLFNQVKGNTITGYFEDGDINFVKAKGAAENIYYASDDNGAFIGANRSTSDVIDVYFQNRKPNKVVLRNNLAGTISPMRGLNHSEFKVRGFKWLEDKRPKTKYELLGQ
jgi:hypothetical protein